MNDKMWVLLLKASTSSNVFRQVPYIVFSYVFFFRINVTEKNFCHMENRTHNLGTNHLHRTQTPNHWFMFQLTPHPHKQRQTFKLILLSEPPPPSLSNGCCLWGETYQAMWHYKDTNDTSRQMFIMWQGYMVMPYIEMLHGCMYIIIVTLVLSPLSSTA